MPSGNPYNNLAFQASRVRPIKRCSGAPATGPLPRRVRGASSSRKDCRPVIRHNLTTPLDATLPSSGIPTRRSSNYNNKCNSRVFRAKVLFQGSRIPARYRGRDSPTRVNPARLPPPDPSVIQVSRDFLAVIRERRRAQCLDRAAPFRRSVRRL